MEPSRMGSNFSTFMKRNAAEIFFKKFCQAMDFSSMKKMIEFHVYLSIVIDSNEDCVCLLVELS